ncbi:hypothetical protein HDU67_004105, partial [Dinochytrium kinnereticum]
MHSPVLRAPSPLFLSYTPPAADSPAQPSAVKHAPVIARVHSPLPEITPRIRHYYEQWGDSDEDDDEDQQDGFFSPHVSSGEEEEEEDDGRHPQQPLFPLFPSFLRPPTPSLPIASPSSSSAQTPTSASVPEKPFPSASLNPLAFLTSFLTPPASPTTASVPSGGSSVPWFSSTPATAGRVQTPPPLSTTLTDYFPQRGLTPPPVVSVVGNGEAAGSRKLGRGNLKPVLPRLRVPPGSRTIFPPPSLESSEEEEDECGAVSAVDGRGLPPLPPSSSLPSSHLYMGDERTGDEGPRSAPPLQRSFSYKTTPSSSFMPSSSPQKQQPLLSLLPRSPIPIPPRNQSLPHPSSPWYDDDDEDAHLGRTVVFADPSTTAIVKPTPTSVLDPIVATGESALAAIGWGFWSISEKALDGVVGGVGGGGGTGGRRGSVASVALSIDEEVLADEGEEVGGGGEVVS